MLLPIGIFRLNLWLSYTSKDAEAWQTGLGEVALAMNCMKRGNRDFGSLGRCSAFRVIAAFLLIALIAGFQVVSTRAEEKVPPEYQSLYDALDRQLGIAEAYYAGRVVSGQTVFTAELLSANAAQGDVLLSPRALHGSVLLMERFRQMGFGGIWISIKYPMLTPEFPGFSGYLDYYRKVTSEARRRGLAVCIDMGSFFEDPSLSRMHGDYKGMTIETYARGTRTMAGIILRELRPDYLGLFNEPDTQSNNTGLDFAPDNFRKFAHIVLDGLDRGDTLIGIGAGTWNPLIYFEIIAREIPVDVLDLHIYPIGRDYLVGKLDAVTQLARDNQKGIVVGESWLYKVTEDEMRHDIAQAAKVFARDVYGFWTPLDVRFAQNIMKISSVHGVQYANFFWSRNFLGAVTYAEDSRRLEPGKAFELLNRDAASSAVQGRYSALGEAVKALLLSRDFH